MARDIEGKRKYPKAPIGATVTGKFFMAMFLGREEEEYPIRTPRMTKGQAVNLTQKMNAYHGRWAEEEGREKMHISARTVEENGEWLVEVGYSRTNAGQARIKENPELEALLGGLERRKGKEERAVVIALEGDWDEEGDEEGGEEK